MEVYIVISLFSQPQLRNLLPSDSNTDSLPQFESRLKTFLFKITFSVRLHYSIYYLFLPCVVLICCLLYLFVKCPCKVLIYKTYSFYYYYYNYDFLFVFLRRSQGRRISGRQLSGTEAKRAETGLVLAAI